MSFETGLLLLGAIGLVSYVARGITGAASAIVFNALFGVALALGLTGDLTLLDGLYWIAMGDFVAALFMLVALRHELTFEPFVRRLLIVTIPVMVLFALLLPHLDVELLALGLGLVLVVSGLYLGLRRSIGEWNEGTLLRRAGPTGVAMGALSGLYGMPGPVFMVYLAHAGEDTGRFRARSTIITATLSIVRAFAFVVSGAIGADAAIRFGLTLPVIFIGLGVGMWLHPKVGPRAFRYGLGLIIVIAGAILMARTIMN